MTSPLRQPTADEKRKAQEFKEKGNECFKKQFWEAAVENYTSAISLNPWEPTYRTNRALAYMKQEKWNNVIEDSRKALAADDRFFKAYYFLGMGLAETGQFEDAIANLNRAKSLAPETKHLYDCDRAILLAKKRLWTFVNEKEAEKSREFQNLLQRCIAAAVGNGFSEEDIENLQTKATALVNSAASKHVKMPIPDYLCCGISMCLFREPVTSPSGVTYEKMFLLEHLARNGQFDPVTREPCKPDQVRPNLAVKDAVVDFLESNPWAVDEML
eukprot:CAMPEP_0113846558 /NCGR_PEP_ID=MMETSP0372-20130328/1374_1 /TAXON_ID=340204 /ORGANISM="Lankesteria abbotti" /LENGTH=271 /DNA_ID=CAMNT_0000815715 /DNA_START=168 /DNA_END=983 /DNA_ORIENTATION=+ /assembly_acc=CAM_ASM_000359